MAVRSVRSSRRSSISLFRVRSTFAVGRIAEARIIRMVAVAMSSRYVNPASRRSLLIVGLRAQEVDRKRDVQARRVAPQAAVLAKRDGTHGDEVREGFEALQERRDLPI